MKFRTIINKCLIAYKTYYAFATRKAIPKPKYVRRSVKEKTKQAPKASFGKRIKSAAKKQNTTSQLSTQGFGTNEGTGVTPGVLDVPTYESDDEKISWKSRDDEDDDDEANFSTHDEEDKEEDSFDPRVQTPSHVGSTNDEDTNEEIHGVNVKGDELDEEETNEDDEEMNYTGTPDTCIDFIFNLNIESASLVDVSVTTITEPPLLFATTIPPPPTPLITHLQQTPVPTSLQSDRLRDEAQAENKDFIKKLDDNIKKIFKDQVKEQVKAQVFKILQKIQKTINEQLEAEVLTRSSNESKASHAVAANLSELELKKILIDKIKSTKSIHGSDE
nr:hypothetical protein [Tanacetum cinerariifolium]